MKRRISVLVFCLLIAAKVSVFAQVKPYLAIVNTGSLVFKGILYQVTPDSIGVKGISSVVFFKSCNIKSIKLKELKKGSKYTKYVGYDSYNEKNYVKVSKKMVPVRKWGENDPTIEEELSCRIISSFYSAAINGVTSSMNFLRSGLETLNINYNDRFYKNHLASLTYLSFLYQKSPEAMSNAQGSKTSLASKELN
jgi:hypothetical protein